MSVKNRIKRFASSQKLRIVEFEKSISAANGYVNSISKGIGADKLALIVEKYPNLNIEWLLTGKGAMLKKRARIGLMSDEEIAAQDAEVAAGTVSVGGELPATTAKGRKKIPLYDDVSTVGGMLQVADMNGVSAPSEWIDAGDWFRDATAAIRHYGDSMREYPSGCILALREIGDKTQLIWGEIYMIETLEYRITKRVQKGVAAGYITAYSSNNDVYPDGRLIHEPVDIAVVDIRRISLVLGYVVKNQCSKPVHITKKR